MFALKNIMEAVDKEYKFTYSLPVDLFLDSISEIARAGNSLSEIF